MKKIADLFFIILFSSIAHAQYFDDNTINLSPVESTLQKMLQDPVINPDSVLTVLSNWDKYPSITATGKDYFYYYRDPLYGNIPLRVFIPPSYSNNQKTSLLLVLHGAVNASNFERAQTLANSYQDYQPADGDIFFNYLSKQNFIIVRPFADPSKNFDWVANRLRESINPTFNTLVDIIWQLKKFLNIDDSKIFALGHSDGSDGAFSLDVYQPSTFAGFVCYNSLLTGIAVNNIYLKNTINRPIYIVHSDLDNLRPIEQAREIIKLLDNINTPFLYKEYPGYKHYDKHLIKDIPFAVNFLKGISRNPFPANIYWEMNDAHNDECDWIKITSFDTTQNASRWHKSYNTKGYNNLTKSFEDWDYYTIGKSAAIKGHYENNQFTIETSRVKEFDVLVSNEMLNLEKPIQVIVNGKTLFDEKISADKSFLLGNFLKNFDRQALWVNKIHIKISR
jgi:predicted esterase